MAATTGCYLAAVSAHGAGDAVVTATINGVSTTINVSGVLNPPLTNSVSLEFSLLTLPSAFAPQLTVSVPAGAPDVDVIGMMMMLPGTNVWRFCATRHVAPGQSVQMFGQYYGDYEIEFDAFQLDAGDPRVIVYLRRADGTIVSAASNGQVVPGEPAEYRGGAPENPWEVC
jgi:hypothetical protein